MNSIIWDWNGTLLNDLDLSVSTINTLLRKRELPLLINDTYKAVFSFPVKDYYQAVGFDFGKENFEIPAKEYIDLYNAEVKNCALHSSATEVLAHFQMLEVRQFVLSAMQQNMLEETLKQQNIFHFFEGVVGLNDHYAVSKVERGEQLITKFNIEKGKALIVGDTIHDFEVAEKLGIRCILIADGHQSAERLRTTNSEIVGSLKDLLKSKYLPQIRTDL